MKIKELSQKTGLPNSTIRYYDSLGLLGEVKREENNYRVFDERDVKVLNFITESKELGFSLSEIEEILVIKEDGVEPCDYVAGKIKEKMSLIDEHIQGLLKKKAGLAKHLEEGEAVCGWKGEICHYIEGVDEVNDENENKENSSEFIKA